MRHGEIIGLRRLNINLSDRRIMLAQTKNGEGRIVYLNQLALIVIASLPCQHEASPTAKIFGDVTPDRVTATFKKVCGKLEIADF